jgi:hypothetical protein
MGSSGGYLHGLIILSVLFALSLGAAVVADAQASVGTDITRIIGVNYLGVDQWIEIANEGTGSMNLTGWTLMNTENQTYSFPVDLTLETGTIVRVHSGEGNNTAADLFNSTLLWNTEGDTATLMDATGKIVSEYKYPIKVSTPGSVAEIKPLLLENMSSISGPLQPFLPDYRRSDYGADWANLKSNSPVNLTGHTFICHGGPLNWAGRGPVD